LTYQLPDNKTLYKASAIGVAAIVVASDDKQTGLQLVESLSQKISIGFVLLPATAQINSLHKANLHVDGKNQILTVLA
jgi:hypothetical protein